jgi:hypothetical protein
MWPTPYWTLSPTCRAQPESITARPLLTGRHLPVGPMTPPHLPAMCHDPVPPATAPCHHVSYKKCGPPPSPPFVPCTTFLFVRSSRNTLCTPIAICPPRHWNPPSGAMDLEPLSSSIGDYHRRSFSSLISPRLIVSLLDHRRLSTISAPHWWHITWVGPHLNHLARQVPRSTPMNSLPTSPPSVTDGLPVSTPSRCRVHAHRLGLQEVFDLWAGLAPGSHGLNTGPGPFIFLSFLNFVSRFKF